MLLSIIIRNLNEAENLRLTLESLKKQVTDFAYEIVVVDNESDDDSAEIAHGFGAKVISMQRATFTYGRALNIGIAQCKGEIIVSLSAHVILLNEYFLQKIPGYFNNLQLAAVRFVQAGSIQDIQQSIVNGPQVITHNNKNDLAAKYWNRLMINHCSAFRKSCWQIFPFDETLPDAEDKHWILEMMKRGFGMMYNVPCFYVYTKEIIRENKIRAAVRGYHGKFLVTGTTDPLFELPYYQSLFKKFKEELRKLKAQMIIHRQIFKGVTMMKKKNTGKQ